MDASAYRDCSALEGYLSVSGTNLTTLDDFSNIKTIKGSMDNAGIGLIIVNNPFLRNIDGLSNLEGSLPGSSSLKTTSGFAAWMGWKDSTPFTTKVALGRAFLSAAAPIWCTWMACPACRAI